LENGKTAISRKAEQFNQKDGATSRYQNPKLRNFQRMFFSGTRILYSLLNYVSESYRNTKSDRIIVLCNQTFNIRNVTGPCPTFGQQENLPDYFLLTTPFSNSFPIRFPDD
jgi:uncharacterized pyridoxamine 5'-phosphate oxidase family protein